VQFLYNFVISYFIMSHLWLVALSIAAISPSVRLSVCLSVPCQGSTVVYFKALITIEHQ